jgi:hypothetical protein
MTDLGRALLNQLGPDDLAQLAERLAPFLHSAQAPADDAWLSTRQAAAYAGCTIDALRKAMAAREVEFEQSAPGAKAWFRRSAIDSWRAR